MDFGVLLLIRNPHQFHRPDHKVYQGHIDNAALAEKTESFNHVWVAEHHFVPDGWSPSQFPVLAAVSQRTERIRLGPFVLLLPHHHPIRVAEDAATVDILSNGRLDLTVGTGAYLNEFKTFGIPFTQRRPRMHEALEIIRRCFNEEEFSHKGKYFEFNNVRVTTKPVQKPIPIWVAANGEQALAEVGERGYHLVTDALTGRSPLYDGGLRKSGYRPENFKTVTLHYGYIGDTHEKAWDAAEPYMLHHMEYQFKMAEELQRRLKNVRMGDPRKTTTVDSASLALPPMGELRKTGRGPFGPAWVGSPDEIIGMLEDELKRSKINEAVFPLGLGGMDPQMARRSMELLAKEVVPHFRNR